jgi:imidazolonepropionase-like amidohydrolase
MTDASRIFAGLACSCVVVAAAGAPRVTVAQLAQPPADAQRYVFVSKAGQHGHAEIWTLPDGTTMERDSLLLRGFVTETESATRLGADGMVSSFAMRGFSPLGDLGESFRVADGKATWKSPIDAGAVAYAAPAFYMPQGPTFSMAVLVKALLASPGRSIALLPAGRVAIERLTDQTIGEGEHPRTLVCWGITGLRPAPTPVWTTQDGRFWGTVGLPGLLPAGSEGAFDALSRAQDQALSRRSAALARGLPKSPSGPVAFTHVRAFVEGTRFAPDQTIIVEEGVIRTLGDAATTPVPAGAQVIEGAGRTLVPGLWDSHQHVADDSAGPFLLSLGVTSARDPGNDDELTLARAQRRAAGELLMPHVYPSSLIDGKGPYTAQVANVATSLDETIALVRRAKAEGFVGVKFYGSLDPAWVAPAAAEAHRLGLHVHGHVPAGMRPSEAIRAGYDEVTHIYFVMMEAMPDDAVKRSNGSGRIVDVGRNARKVDLDADPMKTLVALMRERHTTVDSTLDVIEAFYVPERGELMPALGPYVGTLPAVSERAMRRGGFEVPADLTRADYRASAAKLVALVGALHKAGVRVVAGTDTAGLELVRELELYVQAGFTPAEALAAATIEAARNVGVDGRTGSIAVGKAADLVLVEGDPSTRIGDLRNTRLVMMDGKLLDADALRAAAGFTGRPHEGPPQR